MQISNAYELHFHSLLKQRVNELTLQLIKIRDDDGDFKRHPSKQELDILQKVMFRVVPINPGHPKYRLGKALGKEFTHWLRAKFMQRRRLFFRYSSKHKAIIYVWAGNHNTLRKEGSKRDVYVIFRKMLLNGYPANDFNELLLESSTQTRTILDDFTHGFITAAKTPSVSPAISTGANEESNKRSVSRPKSS